jgi:hypothetical protein
VADLLIVDVVNSNSEAIIHVVRLPGEKRHLVSVEGACIILAAHDSRFY